MAPRARSPKRSRIALSIASSARPTSSICAVGRVTIEQVTRTIWPFYLAMLVVLGLVTYVPAISLAIPNLFR